MTEPEQQPASRTAQAGYSIAEAARITGLTRRQLEYWDQTGLISPTVRRGQGKRRYYAFFDLVELRTVARLISDDRISLQKVRRVVSELEKVRDRPLRTCTLLSGGDQIFWLDDTGDMSPVDVLAKFQMVLAVSLIGVEHEVRRELHRLELPSPPVISGGPDAATVAA